MSDIRLKISPPWVVYAKKLSAIFDEDPQIAFNVNFSSANPTVVLSTDNGEKAAAIEKLLPDEKEFGNVKLSITIVCKNMSNRAFETPQELFETAFEGNPIFSYTVAPAAEGYWYVDFCYIVFDHSVCQFFADNLNDPHGVISILYQDIAEEIFADADIPGNVSYCTAIERKLGKPLGEWS